METRKALIVGINNYARNALHGCVPDAQRMHTLLSHHAKGDPNFEAQLVVSGPQHVSGKYLRDKLTQVFQKECDLALFFFSGHGAVRNGQFCLVAQDHEPIEFTWIVDLLSRSKHREILIILDCCHAGGAGDLPVDGLPHSLLREGVTILAATTSDDYAAERMGAGRFTTLLCRGLEGAAADLFGHVTPASLYAYTDIFLGMWEQRPVFKANVKRMTPVRYCVPPVRKRHLRLLPAWFPSQEAAMPLSPAHDCDAAQHGSAQAEVLTVLMEMERQGLVRPQQRHTLLEEARQHGGAHLTEKGREIWALAKANKI